MILKMNENIPSTNVYGSTYNQEILYSSNIRADNNQLIIKNKFGSKVVQVSNISSFMICAKKIIFRAPPKYGTYIMMGIICICCSFCCGGGGGLIFLMPASTSTNSYDTLNTTNEFSTPNKTLSNIDTTSLYTTAIVSIVIFLILLVVGISLVVYAIREKKKYPVTVILYQLFITMNSGKVERIVSLDWDDIEQIYDWLHGIICENQEKPEPVNVNIRHDGPINISNDNSTIDSRYISKRTFN